MLLAIIDSHNARPRASLSHRRRLGLVAVLFSCRKVIAVAWWTRKWRITVKMQQFIRNSPQAGPKAENRARFWENYCRHSTSSGLSEAFWRFFIFRRTGTLRIQSRSSCWSKFDLDPSTPSSFVSAFRMWIKASAREYFMARYLARFMIWILKKFALLKFDEVFPLKIFFLYFISAIVSGGFHFFFSKNLCFFKAEISEIWKLQLKTLLWPCHYNWESP